MGTATSAAGAIGPGTNWGSTGNAVGAVNATYATNNCSAVVGSITSNLNLGFTEAANGAQLVTGIRVQVQAIIPATHSCLVQLVNAGTPVGNVRAVVGTGIASSLDFTMSNETLWGVGLDPGLVNNLQVIVQVRNDSGGAITASVDAVTVTYTQAAIPAFTPPADNIAPLL